MNRWATVAAVAVPGVALAVAGLFHPASLTVSGASTWLVLHLVLLPVFPLLAGSVWLLLRGERGVLAAIARLAAYVYAVLDTGLDVLAGIGAGYVVARAGGASQAMLDLFSIGNQLGYYGALSFLVAAVVTGVVLMRRDGFRAVPGAVVFVGAAYPFLSAHIYWPVGGLAMLGLAVGAAALAWARPVAHP